MKKEKAIQPNNKLFVKFKRDYIGKLGIFYNEKIYEIPKEIYDLLKIDCEVVL
jgi:hypothetical protein